MRASIVMAAGLALAPVAGHARTWNVSPANPTTLDAIFVETPDWGYCLADSARASLAGNRIVLTYSCPSPYEPPPTIMRVRLGHLPEGAYQLDDTTFTVGPRPAGLQANDFSDLWWNPDESGWGLNIIQHGDGMLFATWFVYATDGSPTWYVIPGGAWKDAFTFEGAIYRTSGPVLGNSPWAAVTVTPVGDATLTFARGALAATLTVDGKTLSKQLQRQSF